MQFKHPEVLWALLLLLIPIIVHLFQLRRFEKTTFTNVKYLKLVELQTRKSSQLKKWLTLLARLLLLACVIIAFAQPFTSKTKDFNTKNEVVVYIDNSFSMQAKGNNGSLLNEVVQDMIKQIPESDDISVFTNDNTYRNTTIKAITNALIQLKHSAEQLSYNAAYLKGKQLFSKDKSTLKHLVLVSDFQQNNQALRFETDSTINLQLVQPKPRYNNNISVDSVFVSKTTSETIELTTVLSQQGNPIENVSVALSNNETLVAKTAVDIDQSARTTFTIPNNDNFKGKITIEDAGLQYDNTIFFNINDSEKIKVLSINDASDDFLKRLYTDDEFEYIAVNSNTINYNQIEEQNLIILNELKAIPNALITALNMFSENGGSILTITSNEVDINSYNQLLRSFSISQLNPIQNTEKRVTAINYDHPVLVNSFSKKVANFQYPKVNSFYPLQTPSNPIYSFEDGQVFLTGNNNTYLFTAAINDRNTNFKKSPLIVPILYNIGKQSLELPQLYHTIGTKNTIDINTKLGQDDILNLENANESTIPLQQTFSKKVSITTDEYPKNAGIFDVKNGTSTLKQLSFNHNRKESELSYHSINNLDGVTIENSIANTIDTIKSNTRINALWKWFVIFALAFLIIEMLLLKYLK